MFVTKTFLMSFTILNVTTLRNISTVQIQKSPKCAFWHLTINVTFWPMGWPLWHTAIKTSKTSFPRVEKIYRCACIIVCAVNMCVFSTFICDYY